MSNKITDIHDNAVFKFVNLLSPLKNFPTQISYYIINIARPPGYKGWSSSYCIHQSNLMVTNGDSSIGNLKSDLVLNQWLKSITEFIIYIRQNKNNRVCSALNCCKFKNDIKNIKDPECNCISQLIDLSKSDIINFFLNSLNANIFKLKYLIEYLNDTIILIKEELVKNNNCTNYMTVPNSDLNDLQFSIMDLNKPFEFTVKSLHILTEIHSFLNSPCSFTVFNLAIKKNYLDKKFFIFSNLNHSTVVKTPKMRI